MNYNFNILPTNSALVYCKPSASIRLKDVNGSTQYIALDNDPQTVLCDAVTHKQLRLSPGTYVILFHAVPNDGSLKNPILYVNYGQGYFEGKKNCFKFTERDKNIWVCDFEIKEKARGLRFDPSIEPVKFFIERMALFNSAHEIIIPRSRVSKFLVSAKNKFSRKKIENENQDTHRISVHSLLKSSNKEPESAIYTQNYRQTLSFAEGGCDASYAPIRTSAVTVAKDEPRVIAFYLPQYHPIPENDKWWGRGFTEWTNVSKATAQFLGHYQPRLPGELGYYDLRLPDIMQRQIELAKLYGVTGFCFHYYWFDGHRLLEKPLDLFLSQKGKGFELDFCLCWANENWTRRWDGSESDILIQQNHSEDDNRRVFLDLLKYLQDPRYIKIDGKPVIVLYRPAIIPDIQKLAALWREEAVKAGFPGLYLISTNSFEFDDPASIDFDALCQFPPHGLWKHLDVKTDQVEKLNEAFSGLV